MAGIRQEKIAELIRRDLSVIFQRQARVWFGRKELGAKIRKQVRIVPELNFYLDDSLDYYEAIDQALKK